MTEPVTPEPRDVSEVGPAAAREAWAEAARPLLLEAAGRYRATVKLMQLASAVQEATGITTSRPPASWMGDVLGAVADDCGARGEPLLSALCVSAQGSVGAGYAEAVERVRGTIPADPDDHAAQERLDCYRHWQATGLPADGGTPLRMAHFTPAAKPRRAAASAPRTPRPARKAAARPTAKKAAEAKPVALCPTCYTALPASGVCDYCD